MAEHVVSFMAPVEVTVVLGEGPPRVDHVVVLDDQVPTVEEVLELLEPGHPLGAEKREMFAEAWDESVWPAWEVGA